MKATIAAIGCYIPPTRIERSTIAQVWGSPAMAGQRAVAAADEDAVTMSVEAAQDCLADLDRSTIDALYFASTTAPYLERQAASLVAGALDLRADIATADFAGTLRAGTAALRAARDAVASGAAQKVLVVVADRRVAEPQSSMEQVFGDGAAAVVVSSAAAGIAEIQDIVSIADNATGTWRRPEDRFIQSYNPKHEIDFGFTAPLIAALSQALDAHQINPTAIWLALPTPDGRAHLDVARRLGVQRNRVADPLVTSVGVLGAAAPFVALASAIASSKRGQRVLVGAAGEGADVVVLQVQSQLPPGAWVPARVHEHTVVLESYGEFARANNLMDLEPRPVASSPVRYWRDVRTLSLHGMRCTACGVFEYPVTRVCRHCKALDQHTEVSLARTGRVFSYTLDHVVAARYSAVPIIRAIIDADGGGRILTHITDCDPATVSIDMPVQLTFRRMNEGGNFKNYYWKARPVRTTIQESEGVA